MDSIIQLLIYLVILVVAILSNVLNKKKGSKVPPDEDIIFDSDESIFVEEKPKETSTQKVATKETSLEEKVQQEGYDDKSSVIQQEELSKGLEKLELLKKATKQDSQVSTLTTIVQRTYSQMDLKEYVQLNKEKILQIVIGNIILNRPKISSMYINRWNLPQLP